MCGLHGIFTNKKELNADDFMRHAFTANMLRGVDSSGIAQVDMTRNEYNYHKLPVSGNFFVQDGVADSILSAASKDHTLTMGHVRAATVGKVSMANAHPFVVEQEDEKYGNRILIGMHNGTLTGWASKKNAKYYNVDSEWALNHIAEEGFDAFEDIRGAFCFTWWDSDKPTMLNIARNSERTLYVAMLKSGGLAYASEAGMLYWLLERNRVDMDGPILELEAGYWYKFDVENVKDFVKLKLPSTSRTYTAVPPKAAPTATVVSKVADLLERAKNQGSTALVPSTNNVTTLSKRDRNVSMTEYKAARDLHMLGEVAAFTPYMEWAEGIEGVATLNGSQMTATVRGYDTRFTEDEIWNCKVIGVQDDDNEIVVILSPPVITEVKETVH